MAYRLESYVLRGEIRNSQRNSVSGWLEVLRATGKGEDAASGWDNAADPFIISRASCMTPE